MKNWLFLSILFFSVPGISQNINPGPDDVFRPDELAVIRLTLSPEAKSFLQNPDNAESEVYFPATFHMINSLIDTVLENPVGIRLRGNTSRYHSKKPFKIDFREYDGEKFFGYKKFNLKPNANDPSQVREPVTLQYYREMNVPAARTHPLRLYMNDEYMGTYLNVEQIDDEFLQSRFGHEDGFLYKCYYGANLLHNGQAFNPSLFESEISEEQDTRLEIDHFMDVLNNTADASFRTEIEKVFDVDNYLRQLAVEALLGHWDGYSFNNNNFYLYYNPETGRVQYIPYDTDNTWGIDWLGYDWATRDLAQWAPIDQPRPLTSQLLRIPAYQSKFKEYLMELLENYFKEEFLQPILDTYKALLDDAVQEDEYFDNSFGFTYDNFIHSFTEGMSNNHVKYGITEFMHVRTQSAIAQLPELVTSLQNQKEIVADRIYPNPSIIPQVYYYSSTSVVPMVYSSTGILIPINVLKVDDQRSEISLPESAPRGLYFVQLNKKVQKWIYK